MAVGLLGSIIGLIGLIFGVQANKKLERLQVSFEQLAEAYGVLRSAIEAAKQQGKTVRVELKDALELGDRAVVTVIPASKMEFTGYAPTATGDPSEDNGLWG